MSKEDKIKKIADGQKKSKLPDFKPGDTLKVYTKIKEGNKERIQVFQGMVIACKGGKGAEATFTVRKVSYNVGVEKTFLLHSPRIDKIEVVSHGDVRRAKLYYLRDRHGKSARIKTKFVAQSTEEEVLPKDQIASEDSHQQTESPQAAIAAA